jgi:hypothetical protein
MTDSGRLGPGPPGEGSDEPDYVALADSALFDSVDLAQQPDEVLDAVLSEMAPGARRDSAEARAAQIEVDRRIFARMKAENFTGLSTTKLLFAAYDYAYPVTGYLIGTGRIFGECARLGRPVKRQPGDDVWTKDDRDFLTQTCVDTGVFYVFLEHGLKKGKWDPRRRTALTTYAVNACTLCFPAIYQKWWRGRVLERSFGDMAVDVPDYLQVNLSEPDPAEQAANRVDAERLLMQIPEPARTGLWLRGAHGATQAEAAAAAGLTGKQLERKISQARENLGLTRSRPRKTDQDRPAAPEPEAELNAQEGDRDR